MNKTVFIFLNYYFHSQRNLNVCSEKDRSRSYPFKIKFFALFEHEKNNLSETYVKANKYA